MKNNLKFELLFTLLLSLSMVAAGCNSLPESIYQTYSLERNNNSFSFEYPTYYKKIATDTGGQHDMNKSFKVTFTRTKRINGLTDNFFEITIGSPNIYQVLSGPGADDVIVQDQYETEVAGKPATIVTFTSRGFHNPNTITKAAFLKVDDVWTWSIVLRSEEAGMEQGTTDFQHIIDTFKIIP